MPISKKKDSKLLSCRLAKDADDKLTKICEESGLSKTRAVERAIRKYYEEYEKTGRF